MSRLKTWAGDIVGMTLSSLMTALAVNFFFSHTHLAPGGLTGLAIILSSVTKIPLEYMTLMVSVPLLILGALLIGSKFGVKTVAITLMIPLFIRLVPNRNFMVDWPFYLQLIVSMITGGLFIGISIGIALRRGCATGGTDLLAILIRKLIKVGEISSIVFICDGLIILLSGIVSQNAFVAVCSFLTLLIIIPTIKKTSGEVGIKEHPPIVHERRG